jgi:antitoxin component YwqK of YwqJK toxin-antitoxin module
MNTDIADTHIINTLNYKYPSKEGYVFRPYYRDWIIVFKKIDNTGLEFFAHKSKLNNDIIDIIDEFIMPCTVTDESRNGIKDVMYATYRADKLQCIDIVHKFSINPIDYTSSIDFIKWIIGKVIRCGSFGEFSNDFIEIIGDDLNCEFCLSIDYFKSLEKAFYYNKPPNYSGRYKKWYYNGQPWVECTYKNEKLDGEYKQLYINGQIVIKCTYKDGEFDGLSKVWHQNGQLIGECTYKNGIYDGLFEEWYSNGQLKKKCTYEGGKRVEWMKWYENGQLEEECTFKNEKKN